MLTLVFCTMIYISTSNILITSNDGYHIILIDFGKVTKITNAKLYHLSLTEQQEYTVRYPHLAPEVIGGKRRQSVYSDMYSIGLVFYRITDHCRISGTKREDLKKFAERCRSIDFFMRPKSSEALRFFETLLVYQT